MKKRNITKQISECSLCSAFYCPQCKGNTISVETKIGEQSKNKNKTDKL